MSDSLDPNVTAALPEQKDPRPHAKKRGAPPAPSLPDWAPWAILGGLIVVGAVGGRAVQAANTSSDQAKSAAPTATVPASSAPATTARVVAGPGGSAIVDDGVRIGVLHLVVTHADSAMGRHFHVTRTRDEAKARASEALARARKGEDFSKLITEYTDDPTAKETHGELKRFGRKDAIPSFADAAFKLKVGELSDVVDTPLGYMVILRTK